MSTSKVLVLEDEWIVAENTARILREAGYDIPAVLTQPESFRAAVTAHAPALALVDIHLGEGDDGIEVVRATSTELPVIYVSAFTDPATVARAGTTRCRGFVVKPFTDRQLLTSVSVALAAGRDEAGAALQQIRTLLAQAQPPKGTALTDPRFAVLSRREREIVDALVEHRRVNRVAKALFISPHTVRNHLKAIFAKLDVHSQEDLFDLVARPPA